MACPDDAALAALLEGEVDDARRVELVAHLEQCAACQAAVAAASADDDPGRQLRPGDELGHYRVIALIGAGAMGAVYRARDLELDRDVALKLVRAELDDDGPAGLRGRLRAEARALAQVSSPYVVTIYEVGAGGAGAEVFLAMEFVDGPTVRDWLAEAPRALPAIAAVFAQAARGLAAAHAAGVVHRDVKPDNILIGPDGRARVGDFGLARAPHAPADGDGGALATRRAGTPAYMAPEVRAGGAATPRADQYALCLALAEAVLGQRPDAAALAGLPAPLARIVARGLAPDPAARWPSLLEVADALDRVAAPAGGWRWRVLLGGLAVTGAIATAVAVAGRAARACTVDEPWARAALATVPGALGTADPVRGPQIAADVVARLDGWRTRWRDAGARACDAGPAAAARLRCLALQAREVATIVGELGQADAALVARAPALVRSLPEPDACAAPPPPPRSAASRVAEAVIDDRLAEARGLLAAGRFAAARDRAEAALTAAHGPAAGAGARAAVVRARILRDSDGAGAAEDPLRAAAAAAIAAGDDRALAEALVGLADLRSLAGDVDGHGEIATLAEAMLARAGGDAELAAMLAQTRCTLAWKHGVDLEPGWRDCQEARRRWIAASGPDSPNRTRVDNSLGALAFLTGRYDQAIAHFRAYIADVEALQGVDHPNADTGRVNLATTLARIGRWDEATALLAGVTARRPTWASAWDTWGYVHRRRGEFDAAIEAYARAEALALAAAPGSPDVCDARLGVVEAQLDAGRGSDVVEPSLALAAERCAQVDAADERGRLALVRGRALARGGARAAARESVRAGLAVFTAAPPPANSPADQTRAALVALAAELAGP